MSKASDMLPSAGSRGPCPSVLLAKWGKKIRKVAKMFEVWSRSDKKGGERPK